MNQIDSVLVTGGTGTFGQAFIRHLLETTQLDRIVCYSRGEHSQAAFRDKLLDPDNRVRWMIGDVRDVVRLQRAMQGVEAVVHAAALKRIETGQYNPDEMVSTNVLGTANVVQAANEARSVRFVVTLSSDKAHAPKSPYGLSKGLAEALTLAANATHGRDDGPRYACTRYGNVWMAQGSVVPRWLDAVQRGDPILVTDPFCTRFFMTSDEAVQLVCSTLSRMQGGELVIPDWLPAYDLGTLAEVFCEVYSADMKVIGLPAFEKLHESMDDTLHSNEARRMTKTELLEAILNV